MWLRHWQSLFSPFIHFAVPARNITHLLLVLWIYFLYVYVTIMMLSSGQSFLTLGWHCIRLWPWRHDLCLTKHPEWDIQRGCVVFGSTTFCRAQDSS